MKPSCASSHSPQSQCTISSNYLISFLAFSLVVLCTSEALVPSHTTSFLPRAALWGTRGGSETTSSLRKNPLTCVLQVPRPTRANGSAGDCDDGMSNTNNNNVNANKKNGISKIDLSSRSSTGPAAAATEVKGSAAAPPVATLPTTKKKNGSSMKSFIDPAMKASYIAETKLPTDVGHFQLRAYRTLQGTNEHVGTEPCVIYCADKSPFGTNGELRTNVPVRIHDQCLTSEVFRSQRCDCKEQLRMSLEYIQQHGGAIIYLQQEGRGIGLANKVAAYSLQDAGLDTVDANLSLGFDEDCRQYGAVPSILNDMGIGSIQLMTNNPRKVDRLRALGVNVVDTLPMVVPSANRYNRKYLETKHDRMAHANFGPLFNKNGAMAPKRPTPKNYSGDELAANAVHVSLMADGGETIAKDTVVTQEQQAGVTASEDGYCFGRQSVEDAIAAVGNGEMVVVVDDMDRENEGDLIMAADLCTPQDMATIVRYSSGVICVGMDGQRMDELKLPAMVTNNEDPKGTAFSVTVDATKEHGITTGISATDRARTCNLLADPKMTALDFARPGHVFPLRAREGGVLTRDGHTEASVDLSVLAGRAPAAILCEIVSEENPIEMMRLPELKRFAKRHGYVLTSIVDIAQYRRDTEAREFQ